MKDSKEKKRSDKQKFNQVIKNIKSIKIQGATNVAREAAKAYFLIPSNKSKRILINSRPTEPMMEHVLNLAESGEPLKKILDHFKDSQDKINSLVIKKIKNNDEIFTHCHSSTVTKALIYSKQEGKKFQVYNTETRPLYQGRKTARELQKAGIKVTMLTDSAMGSALTKGKETGLEKIDIIFLGADALLKDGIINKIGSELVAHLAKEEKILLYILADSWKFTTKKTPIEQRSLNEVWNKAPKNIKIKNPAFEFVPKKYITKIITELGEMSYSDFVKNCKKR